MRMHAIWLHRIGMRKAVWIVSKGLLEYECLAKLANNAPLVCYALNRRDNVVHEC
jgi:hypothetical protein